MKAENTSDLRYNANILTTEQKVMPTVVSLLLQVLGVLAALEMRGSGEQRGLYVTSVLFSAGLCNSNKCLCMCHE